MGAVVGDNLRRLREQSRLTQYEAAHLVKQYGLRWSRSKIAAIEAGERSTVSLADVLLLALAFRVSITEFFEGDGDVMLAEHLGPVPRDWAIAIMQGNHPPPEITRQQATEREHHDVEHLFATIDAFARGPDAIEADHALARRLGVPVDDVVRVARSMWGRTLTDERDARVVELGAMRTAERQAHRGPYHAGVVPADPGTTPRPGLTVDRRREEETVSDPIKRIELADGKVRYRFVVDIGRNPKTGNRRQLTKTFDTKKEARAAYAQIRHQTEENTLVAPAKVTVAEWLDTWLASATIDVEKATAHNYADALRPVHQQLGQLRLQELCEQDIDELVAWMLTSGRVRGGRPGTGLSVRSVQLTLGRLRSALSVAVRRKLVVRNVAQYTQIPRDARNKAAAHRAERTPWTDSEVRTFLAAIRNDRLYAPVLLSLIGMRPAEVCGLRWDAVDLDAGTLTIALTRTLVDGEVEEKGPKSEKGKRTLPLPTLVTAALKSARARQAREKLAAGVGYTDTGYVLVDELGHPFKTDQLRRAIYKLMATAGVRKVRPYDARHGCLTYLATSGVPDVVVSAWAGHADLSFTKRVYVHPNVEHLKEAAQQLDTLLR